MVIVNIYIRKQSRLFERGIILGIKFATGNRRSLEIGYKREFESVFKIRALSAVLAIIKVTFQFEKVLSVVFKVVIRRIEIDFDSGRSYSASAVMRFNLIVNLFFENYFARYGVGNGGNHFLGAAQKSRVYIIY